MPAMFVNDNAGCLTPRGVLSHAFAGTLAPLRVGAGQRVWEYLSLATESQAQKNPLNERALRGDLAFSIPGYRIWRSGRDSNPRPPA